MKRMLDLLYAGQPYKAFGELSPNVYCKYKRSGEWLMSMWPDDLSTMLLLIAVAEGETL